MYAANDDTELPLAGRLADWLVPANKVPVFITLHFIKKHIQYSPGVCYKPITPISPLFCAKGGMLV